MRRSPIILALGLSLGAGALPAEAAPNQPPHASGAAKHKADKLHVQGLVVSHTSSTVSVLVKAGAVGRRNLAHHVLTLPLLAHRSARTASAPTLSGKTAQGAAVDIADGDDITFSGIQTVDGIAPTDVSVTPAPAMALLGFSKGLDTNGNLRVRAVRTEDGRRGGSDGKATAVNTSAATITLDGHPAAATSLPAGALVIVLGERDDDIVTAASVTAYSQLPAFAAGTVTAATATTLTLTNSAEKDHHHGDRATPEDNGSNTGSGGMGSSGDGKRGDGNGADQSTTHPVDLTIAAVFLNGTTSPASALTVGDHAVVIGAANPDGTLVATLVLAFDAHDTAPAPRGDDGGDDNHGGNGGVQDGGTSRGGNGGADDNPTSRDAHV